MANLISSSASMQLLASALCACHGAAVVVSRTGWRLHHAAHFSQDSFLQLEAKPGSAEYEVVSKSSIKSEGNTSCICEKGQFWNSGTHTCIDKGGRGYECGFFPKESQRFACAEGLTCRVLEGSDNQYFHPGAAPASCQPCKSSDHCSADNNECVKEYLLSGNACCTVRAMGVKAPGGETEATAKYTAKATASAGAEATATATAKGVQGEVTAERSAASTHTATAEATAEAAASAGASGKGGAVGEACVSIGEVKEVLKISQAKVRLQDAELIVRYGDELAYDHAVSQVKVAVKSLGKAGAQEASKQAARQQALDDARDKAQKMAHDKALEEATAGAEKKAMEEAQAAADKAAKAKAEAQTTTIVTTTSATTSAATTGTTTKPAPTTPTTTSASTTAETTTVPTTVSTTTPAPTTTAAAPKAKPGVPLRPQKQAKMVEPPQDPQVEVPRKVPKADVAASLP